MAVADAKLTGRPGVVLVSRGPGACNASHRGAYRGAGRGAADPARRARCEKRDLRRNAFQEIDYANMFRGVAKWVGEADRPRPGAGTDRPRLCAGDGRRPRPRRPLAARGCAGDGLRAPLVPATLPSSVPPTPADAARLAELLRGAERPILLAGHGFDTPGGREALLRFAEAWQPPRRRLLPPPGPVPQPPTRSMPAISACGTRMRSAPPSRRLTWCWRSARASPTSPPRAGPGPPWAGARPAPGACLRRPALPRLALPRRLAIAADARAMIAALAAEAAAGPPGRAAWNARLRRSTGRLPGGGRPAPDGVPFARVAKLVERVAPRTRS